MKRFYFSFVLAVVLSAAAGAQQPAPTAKLPTSFEAQSNNEVFGGFLYEPTDWGPAWQKFYGLNANYTRFFGHHWGVVADFDWTRNNASLAGDLDRGQPHNANTEAYRFGARYDFRKHEHRVQPYAVFLVGGAHMSALMPYPGRQSPLVQKSWTGFTWAAGGGVDFLLTHHLGVRGQWDHTQLPWGTEKTDRTDWDRVSAGAFWRW